MTEPFELGRPSTPGMGPEQPQPPREDWAADHSVQRAQRAAYDDASSALRVGAVAAVPTATLIALAFTAAAGWYAHAQDEGTLGPGPWPRSLLALVLLMVALQLVSTLLALEHLTYDASRPQRWIALVLIAVMRLIVLAVVASAILVGKYGRWDTWPEVGRLAAAIEGGALLILFLSWRLVYSWVGSNYEHSGPSRMVAGHEREHPRAGTAPVSLPDDSEGRLLAIGASGGGIRAAAFVLGGHQALQDLAEPLKVDAPECEPPVFAVSGGSYIGAALALRRAFTPHGQPREVPSSWSEAYDMDSPELERLRRHTRYLFEPAGRMRDGAVSLLMGAVVNLALVVVALRLLTWVSGQIAMTVGLVSVRHQDDKLIGIALADAWGGREWALFLTIPALCLAAMVVLTGLSWLVTSTFDNVNPRPHRRRAAEYVREKSAQLRPALLGIGAGWLIVVLVLPAGVVGVVSLMAHNEPTAGVATWLDKVGFGNQTLCEEAMISQLQQAVVETSAAARLSPGVPHEVTTGACGFETTISRTYVPGVAEASGSTVLSDAEVEAARELVGVKRLPGQIAGIGGLLLVVVSLLRHGPSPETSAATGLVSRARRALLMWLPLAIVGSLATYLMLVANHRFLTALDETTLVTNAAVTVAACAVAYLIDANATSMHGFYRARLSDAFAVGVDDATRVAEELPPPVVYRFSQLAKGSIFSGRPAADGEPAEPPVPARSLPLRIVTTVNSLAANEAPTMRGGFPMVFGPDRVEMHREARQRLCVSTRAYEQFAGAGRVSIMATVATSGAAISPLMGRYGAQMAPYRLLLTLFNLRVGTWVRNPMHVGDNTLEGSGIGKILWMTRKPGLAQVALEAFGNSSANRRWIYLSDGGHLDNTGLVECVRHCVIEGTAGRIVVLDASNDPVDTWSAVGDAISVVRADLEVDLRRVWNPPEPPWMRRYTGAGLDVVVVKAVRTELPGADSNDLDWSDQLPPNVQSFQLVNKDFPRSSTARQKFGDLEFEAYRSLGYAATLTSLQSASWV